MGENNSLVLSSLKKQLLFFVGSIWKPPKNQIYSTCLVILHRTQDATFSNSRRGWIVLLLNNNLRNSRKTNLTNHLNLKYAVPCIKDLLRSTRKVNSLSSKHLKSKRIGPMIFLVFDLYRRKRLRKQRTSWLFLVILSLRKKKKSYLYNSGSGNFRKYKV